MKYAPDAYTIKGVTAPPVTKTEGLFQLPDVNQNIESPNATPGSGIIPNLAIPAATPGTQFDIDVLETPPATERIE